MKKFLILIFTFCLLTFPSSVSAANMLSNNGMENTWTCSSPKDCYPGNWTKFDSIWWQQEDFVKHSGSYSMKLSGDNNYGSGGSGGIFQTIAVEKGARYVISGYSYRFYSKSADSIGIQFNSGGIGWYPLYGLHGTQGWYRFSIQVDAPADAIVVKVYLKGENNPSDITKTPNDVYFDDISVDLISLPLKATISGPASAANGDSLKFIGEGNGGTSTISSGGIYVAKLDNGNPIPTSLSWCLKPANQNADNIWCKIYQQSFTDNQTTKSFGDTTSWTPLMAGNYLVVVNTSDSGGRNCGGNPYPLPLGWTDCDPSGKDTIPLTVSCARPNAPTNLTPTGTTIMPRQNLTYTGPTLDWDHTNNIASPDTVSFNVWVNNLDVNTGDGSQCDPTLNGDLCKASANYTLYDDYHFSLGGRYVWWVQAVNSCGGITSEVVSTEVTIPAYPTISSLQVSNSNSTQTINSFSGDSKVSGLQGSEGGSNWLNPMNITLNATAWNGDDSGNSIKQYFVAFYDKKEGTSTIQPAYTSIISNPSISEPNPNLKNLLINYPDAGFLLAYNPGNNPPTTGKHYLWDPTSSNTNKWVDITGLIANGLSVCGFTDGVKDCDNKLYYTVFPGNTLGTPSNPTLPHSWDILLYKKFGGKSMYTGGYVTDNNGLTTYQTDINP